MRTHVGEEGRGGINQHVRYPFPIGDGEGVEAFEFTGEGVGFESGIAGVVPEPFGVLGEPVLFHRREPSRAFEKVGRKLYLHTIRGCR
ncbi:hypothetical protein A2973_04735 [Candidatus Gottesmanbacteria bacterium RIFCSPLOWO2_01_FULL_49_10]|uniref:Uncharacterized protein n=1 Tax=Candidatus Gottesmanbacteria bacterium RIFCSPLOWO2_01_FULL_49_10 TaxID=1798396 RepID=A0A1F6B0P0_9BACT|nr:MAG: hypothetical protein A2973_04735 [Candidatus Gottesmanbacteria bacterium RIFCSPLOWO2_01_FULL_49_10]